MHQRGLLPISADPITNGHLDLIRRAAAACKTLLVLVSDNDHKRGSYLFSLAERKTMTERAVRLLDLSNVDVHLHTGLLADAFLYHGADVIFRGIRTSADRTEDERQMRYHDLICPGIAAKVSYLEADEKLRDVSSTLVKAFVLHDVDVSLLVPVFVKAALEERLRHQWKIAITGEIASGKTWVTRYLAETLTSQGCLAHTINFDQLVRDLYVESSPSAQHVRERLAALCGDGVLTPDRSAVHRRVLAERLFHPDTPSSTREAVHELTAPHVMRLYRHALHDKKGVVLIEWAQLAEMNLASLANHRSIVVHSPERSAFAEQRGLTSESLQRLSAHQWSADQKVADLTDQARNAGGGMILRYENCRGNQTTNKQALSALADAILQALPSPFRGGNS